MFSGPYSIFDVDKTSFLCYTKSLEKMERYVHKWPNVVNAEKSLSRIDRSKCSVMIGAKAHITVVAIARWQSKLRKSGWKLGG
jgi:hypothetical protein